MLLQSRKRMAVGNAVCGLVHSCQHDVGNNAGNEEICCSHDKVIGRICCKHDKVMGRICCRHDKVMGRIGRTHDKVIGRIGRSHDKVIGRMNALTIQREGCC